MSLYLLFTPLWSMVYPLPSLTLFSMGLWFSSATITVNAVQVISLQQGEAQKHSRRRRSEPVQRDRWADAFLDLQQIFRLHWINLVYVLYVNIIKCIPGSRPLSTRLLFKNCLFRKLSSINPTKSGTPKLIHFVQFKWIFHEVVLKLCKESSIVFLKSKTRSTNPISHCIAPRND